MPYVETSREMLPKRDVSQEFLTMSSQDFLNFLRNQKDSHMTVNVDIADMKLNFDDLQKLLSESHIYRFTIKASEAEKQSRNDLFIIAGVHWQRR